VSRSRSLLLAVAMGLATALAPTLGIAQVAPSVGVLLTVSHASPKPGPIDPDAAEIHRQLRHEFRYESLRVIERRHVILRMQELGGIDLPTGKRVELRPLSLTPSGVLIAVEIEGTLQTDLRVPNRKQVVIGVDRYQDGKLILTLQPDY
jgi:hypothetical protein